LAGDLLGFALDAAGVDLGEDLFQAHAALAELGAVQEHGRHGHDLALLDSSWKVPPSIIVVRMRGFCTAIRFSACTTSGQLWQVSET
jgi:hypothetical protein